MSGMLVARRDWHDLTYESDVSVALLLSASESAATPASPILLSSRLQRERWVRDARGEKREGRRHRAGRARLT